MSTASLNATFSRTLVRALAAAGACRAVISPGSRNTPLVLALEEAARERSDPAVMQVHTVLDERAAGFVALGWARATAAPVLLVCTSGSAGAHYLPAVIEAHHSRVPLVVLTADRPVELHHCGAPQTVEQRSFFADFTHWNVDLGAPDSDFSPQWLATMAAVAADHATADPAGPVHINVAFREPLWEPHAKAASTAIRPVHIRRGPRLSDTEHTAELADRLARTSRGLIVCGPLPPNKGRALAAPLTALAARLGWPLLAEPTSQLRYGRHDLGNVVSTYDSLLRDDSFAARLRPELVLRFGQYPTSKVLGRWLAEADSSVLVDEAAEWRDPTFAADTLVAADAAQLCRALLDALGDAEPETDWLRSWLTLDNAATGILDGACSSGFWEGAVARRLVQLLPAGTPLHVASSMPVRDLDGFTTLAARELPVLANRGANGIDGTVATAAGEALGYDRPAMLLIGDLALLHDLGGLAAAAQLGVSLHIVVLNNGGGHIFDHLPIAAHPTAFEPHFIVQQSTRIAAACQSVGARWLGAESLDELADRVTGSLAVAGVSVIEAKIDPVHNLNRHHDAWGAVHQALAPYAEEAA